MRSRRGSAHLRVYRCECGWLASIAEANRRRAAMSVPFMSNALHSSSIFSRIAQRPIACCIVGLAPLSQQQRPFEFEQALALLLWSKTNAAHADFFSHASLQSLNEVASRADVVAFDVSVVVPNASEHRLCATVAPNADPKKESLDE